MRCSFLLDSLRSKPIFISFAVSAGLAACAQLSVTPRSAQEPDPAVASHAIKAEPVLPTEVVVHDFEFSPTSVKDNSSPAHRAMNLFRQSSADQRKLEIGQAAAASLSEQTVKQVNKLGLRASRISAGSDESLLDNILLVTGRLIDANEGNRLTRIALGLGAGESALDTEVHVFRVVQGERAEVLAFTTHADSGKMPGLLPSLGVGELFIGPITAASKAKDAASTGGKIYSSQLDHLASKTGKQVARYLSQYAANEGWIPRERAESVKLAAR
jgi:hypothetical protein